MNLQLTDFQDYLIYRNDYSLRIDWKLVPDYYFFDGELIPPPAVFQFGDSLERSRHIGEYYPYNLR